MPRPFYGCVRALLTGLLCALLAVACRPPYAAAPATTPAPSPAAADAVPSWGDADAPVSIVEFADLQCPFCERAEAALQRVRESYGPNRVRIEWRHFPLPFHKQARPAHEAAATVFALGGAKAFFAFTALALAHREELNEASFEAWAERAGVERSRFVAARRANHEAAQVLRDIELGDRQGIDGTPNFLINGVLLAGAQPFERFQELIDAELAEAQKLAANGVARAQLSAQRTQQNFKKPQSPRPEAPEDNTVWQVPVAADDPVRGPADALVTIVGWSDYQCPYCKRVEQTLGEVRAAYPTQVRVVWKDNPLPFHPHASPAALLAQATYRAKGNEAFWQLHDALFEAQSELSDESLAELAKRFDVASVLQPKSKQREQAQRKLDDSVDTAVGLQANGTPHFFVNGVRLSGARPFADFKSLIDAQLEKAQKLQASGVAAPLVYAELMKTATPPPPPETKDVPAADASSPARGGEHAKVTIQIFSDFQCPFCKRVNPTLEALEKEFGGELRLVFRQHPLPFHQHAALAAEASLEAFAQKGSPGFWAYHDKLFEVQAEPGGLERKNLEVIAQSLGLDVARFREALDAHRHEAKVKADSAVAEQAGIDGTPGFAINGYFVGGAQAPAAFKRVIRRALEDAQKVAPAQAPSQPKRTK
ncbi:MAG: thioredoxin domain-containing protein [Polyangiaceae bacterium]